MLSIDLDLASKPGIIGTDAVLGSSNIKFEVILAHGCGQTTLTAAGGSSDCSGTSPVRVSVVGLALGESIVAVSLVHLAGRSVLC